MFKNFSLIIGTAAMLFALLWVAVLWVMGLYRIGARWSLLGEARDIAKAYHCTAILAPTQDDLLVLAGLGERPLRSHREGELGGGCRCGQGGSVRTAGGPVVAAAALTPETRRVTSRG